MRRIKIILHTLLLVFILFLFGCKTDSIEISAQITSVTTTKDSITFYETIHSNTEVTARALLEQGGKEVDEINSLTIGATTEYTFTNLTAGTEYVIFLQLKTDASYVTYAKEVVQTTSENQSELEIICENKEVPYDGTKKVLQASTNVEELPLIYKYTLNGVLVEEPIQVGEYRCEISFLGNENYSPCSIIRTLKIVKADLTIIAENESFIYDGKEKQLSASIDGGFPLEYTYYEKDKIIDFPVNVGEYRVVISFSGNDSYNSTTIERTLTIQPCSIDITLESFEVEYDREYVVEPNLSMSYMLIFYQDGIELEEKPKLPGLYTVKVVITDSNYVGSKEVEFTIHKAEYNLPYEDMYALVGAAIAFEVEDFVQIEYYLNGTKVSDFSSIGTYEVIFFFTEHHFYKDFTKKINVVIDHKYRLAIEAEDAYYEEGIEYEISYKTNYDVELNIAYYYNDIEIAKPNQAGIYRIRLSYAEDQIYYGAEAYCTLYLYPEQQEITELKDGLYHILGTVLTKNNTYSFIAYKSNVLLVEDLSLELGASYDLVGIFDTTESILKGSVLKKTKISTISVEPVEASLLGFAEHMDEYLYQFISLKGMVIQKEDTYALALEEDYSITLNKSYKEAFEQQKAVEIQIIFYGVTYELLDFTFTELTDEEMVYAQALLYTFEDIVDTLPLETVKPFETSISYITSSNPEVIRINPLQVIPPRNEDKMVQLEVCFTVGDYSCTQWYEVKVLKEEIKELKIYSIEMHQQYGDSTLITYGDYEILIDAGDKKDGPYVNKFLKEHISEDNHLDMMIVTHCHSDHMGGLAYASNESQSTVKALDGIATIGTIIDYGHDRSTNALHNSWVDIRNSYINKGAEYYPVYDCAKNTNGASSHHQIDRKLSLDFIDTMTYALPSQNISTELNIYSIATLLTFENFKFFFAGDLEDKGESNLYKNLSNTPLKNITEDNVVLYKAAHHGTDPGANNGGVNGGNQLPFLRSLKPDYFFASAAMCLGNYPTNSSGDKFIGGQPHPYIKCIANFLKFNDNVYFNGTNGTLEFITDGYEMKSIRGAGATTKYLLEVNGTPIDYASQANLKLVDTLWYRKNRKAAVDNILG